MQHSDGRCLPDPSPRPPRRQLVGVWFEGLQITNEGNGEAVLTGPVADQAALHGLLVRVRDLGLPLIEVKRTSTSQQESQEDE